MGEIIGYARVSTAGQLLSAQISALTEAGCKKIYQEKQTGVTRYGREELEKCLDYVREGDVLIITRLDRLARSISDLYDITRILEKKGVKLRATEQPIDTTTAIGRALFGMLAVFAVFENDLRRERQKEGIAAAKAKGAYKGRPPSINADEIRALKKEGLGPTYIAKKLGITRQSVYRLLGDS